MKYDSRVRKDNDPDPFENGVTDATENDELSDDENGELSGHENDIYLISPILANLQSHHPGNLYVHHHHHQGHLLANHQHNLDLGTIEKGRNKSRSRCLIQGTHLSM